LVRHYFCLWFGVFWNVLFFVNWHFAPNFGVFLISVLQKFNIFLRVGILINFGNLYTAFSKFWSFVKKLSFQKFGTPLKNSLLKTRHFFKIRYFLIRYFLIRYFLIQYFLIWYFLIRYFLIWYFLICFLKFGIFYFGIFFNSVFFNSVFFKFGIFLIRYF
jgi:hypothetical protein